MGTCTHDDGSGPCRGRTFLVPARKVRKKPAWGGADREAYRYISGFVAWYPGFKPPSPRPLPAPVAAWFNIDFGGGLGVRGIINCEFLILN